MMDQGWKESLFYAPQTGLMADWSGMDLNEEFLDSMQQKASGALAGMKELEGGAIANPDEGRMVGHYWLRAPQLAPTPELRKEIEDCVAKIKRFVYDVHSGKVRTEREVRKYDLAFSYEVFEGKILSAIRTIAYSDDRKNCGLYIGDDDLTFMDDLVDIRYRGASKFEEATLTGDYQHISMTVYLDNIYYTGDCFTQKRENFVVGLVRHKDARTSSTFTAILIFCADA